MNENAIPGAPEDFVHIFVSYAREDRRWLDPDYRFSLIPFLKDSLRRHNVAFWFDKELKPGDEFKRLIESEIDQSQIALLIVSQSFLNSEFIENREMPRIAERARQGKMIVVPVLVEPCDWSEYPFLADRQMVPSSPLIDYTESEPQWAKVRFQILDGLKAQLKRIREAPQAHAFSAAAQEAAAQAASRAEEETEQIRQQRAPEAEERRNREKEQEELRLKEAAEREAKAQAASRAERETEQIKQHQEREAEERRNRENEQEELRLKEAAEREAAAQAALRAEEEGANVRQRREREAAKHEMDRASRRWIPAVLGGAALAWVVSFLLFLTTLQANWLVAFTGGAALVVVLVCLQVFKPLPRNWTLAVVGLAAMVWVYFVFFTEFSAPLLLFVIGQVPMVVLVCLLISRSFWRNWTPAAVSGAIVWTFFLFCGPLLGFVWAGIGGVPLAAVLVCLLVFRRAKASTLEAAPPPSDEPTVR